MQRLTFPVLPLALVLAILISLLSTPPLRAEVSPPPNDAFADAVELSALAGSISGTTVGASLEDEEIAEDDSTTSVWYSFTAPEDGILRLEVIDGGVSLRANVLRGESLLTLEVLESFVSVWGETRVTVTGGTRYWISIGDYIDGNGTFDLIHEFRDHSPYIITDHAVLRLDGNHGGGFTADFTLTNDAAEILEYSVSSDAAWLVPTEGSGSIGGESDGRITLHITDLAELGNEPTATVTIQSNAANAPTLEIPVTIVQDGLPFAEANLRDAIARSLGKPRGAALYAADFTGVSSIVLSEFTVSDLSGLEVATDLQGFSAPNQMITDLSPLSDLPKLRVLHLPGNLVSDLTPLLGMESLNRLFITENLLDLRKNTPASTQLQALIDAGVEVDFDPQRRDFHAVARIWADAATETERYYESSWFGGFWIFYDHHWFYHQEHGWIFPEAAHQSITYWFMTDLGWTATNAIFYPWIYQYDTDDWLYYLRGTRPGNLRWFYSETTQQWFSTSRSGEGEETAGS